jgi:hypothetical protein
MAIQRTRTGAFLAPLAAPPVPPRPAPPVRRGAPAGRWLSRRWPALAGAALATAVPLGVALAANYPEGITAGPSPSVFTGNVGLGTAAPAEQLQLTGNLRLPPTTATTGIVRSGAATLLHTFGTDNLFVGVGAGNLTTTGGGGNTASGAYALRANTTGHHNTASGAYALRANTTGSENTASGTFALYENTTGHHNTASGAQALYENTTGSDNTASGARALGANTEGGENTASGAAALGANTTGAANTASGAAALFANTTGQSNTASGSQALVANTTGSDNTASGAAALFVNTTGYGNTASGAYALQANTTGHDNTAIGHGADVTSGELTNATAIGARALVGQSNSLVLGGTGADAVSVGVGTTTPRSTLQVVGNYIQFPVITGSEPAKTDCATAAQAGRVVVRTDGPTNLYVCTGTTGWVGK